MHTIQFFSPQAERRKVERQIHHFEDDYGSYTVRDEAELKRTHRFLDPDAYLRNIAYRQSTDKTKAAIELHKRLYKMKRIVFGRWTRKNLQLTYLQMIVIILNCQLCLSNNRQFIAANMQYESLSFLLVHGLLTVTVCMPLFSYFSFMGQFSKKGFIRYWQTMPIFKGFAFTVMLDMMFNEAITLETISKSVYYFIWTCNYGSSWRNCTTLDPDNVKECLEKNATYFNSLNISCPDIVTGVPITTFFEDSYKSSYRIITAAVIVMLLFLSMLFFYRLVKVIYLINVSLLFLLMIPLFIVTMFYKLVLAEETDANKYHHYIQSHEYYLPNFQQNLHIMCCRLASLCIFQILPRNYVTAAARMKSSIKSDIALETGVIFVVMLLFYVLVQVWLNHYMATFYLTFGLQKCLRLKITFNYFLFVVVLDDLDDYAWANVLLCLYCAGIFYWGLVSLILQINILCESLIDAYVLLKKYKLFLYFGICGVLFCVYLYMVQSDTNLEDFEYESGSLQMIRYTLILMAAIQIGIYSISRYSKDFYFTFGYKLHFYWTVSIKFALTVCVYFAILNVLYKLSDIESVTKKQMLYFVGFYFILSSPLIIFIMEAFLNYNHGWSETIIKPEPKWGPPDPISKEERNNFHTNRDIHMRKNIICNHTCFLNSDAFNNEMKRWWDKEMAFKKQFPNLL